MMRTRRSNIPIFIESTCKGDMTGTVDVLLVILGGFVEFVCFLHGSPLLYGQLGVLDI